MRSLPASEERVRTSGELGDDLGERDADGVGVGGVPGGEGLGGLGHVGELAVAAGVGEAGGRVGPVGDLVDAEVVGETGHVVGVLAEVGAAAGLEVGTRVVVVLLRVAGAGALADLVDPRGGEGQGAVRDALGEPPAEDGPEGVGQGLLPVVVGVDEGAVGLGLVGGAGRVDGLDDLVVVAEDGGVLDVAGVGGGGLGLVRGLDDGVGGPVALHVGEQGHDVGVGAA